MFKKSLKSISIVYKYAPWLTFFKLLQIIISASLSAASLFFIQEVIDSASSYVLHNTNLNTLFLWGGLLLFSMLFGAIGTDFLEGILHISLKRRLNAGMTPDVLNKFRRLDYACFESKRFHDTLNRMSKDPADRILQLFISTTDVIKYSVRLIGATLVFLQTAWWLALGFAVLFVPLTLLNFKTADMMNGIYNKQSVDDRKLRYYGELLSNKSSLFELKLFRAVRYIAQKSRMLAKTVLKERVRIKTRAHNYLLCGTILSYSWLFFIIMGLVRSVAIGNITIGIFTALITATGTALDSADALYHSLQSIRWRYLLADHFYNFMSMPEIEEGCENYVIDNPRIEFDNVCFTYPETENQVLNGVSFTIEPGEHVALVGENGAGKSTIIKLLCRLYKPNSGKILIDGHDIEMLSREALRGVFSVVFQDFCRYSLTLRENVAFGDFSKLNDDNALECALDLGLAGDIADLDAPLGKLENSGVDLSGGQWQRVAIARACLSQSKFTILDEPTAALDPVVESEMYNSFSQVLKNSGCIMISHRMASAKMADRIFVLSGGTVAEEGSHFELLERNGLYASMYKAQSAWYVSGGVFE